MPCWLFPPHVIIDGRADINPPWAGVPKNNVRFTFTFIPALYCYLLT